MIDIRKVDYLFQEEFDTSQTIKVITGNKPLFDSWNVDELYNCSGKALLMSMNMGGKKYVIITKNGDKISRADCLIFLWTLHKLISVFIGYHFVVALRNQTRRK